MLYRVYVYNRKLISNVVSNFSVRPLGKQIAAELPVKVINKLQSNILKSCLQKYLSAGNSDTTATEGIS
jgi:hypothetical protein